MSFRRVVTGVDPNGKAIFVEDTDMAGVTGKAIPGAELVYVWGSEQTPTAPTDGTLPDFRMHFPDPGGLRLVLFSMPPAGEPVDWDPTSEQAMAEATAKFPGLMESFDPAHAGFHTSQTIDLAVVLEGSVALELDDGAACTFTVGDFIVQNGTRHKWSNPGDVRAWVAFVLIGADRA
jgi:hypothetical protein